MFSHFLKLKEKSCYQELIQIYFGQYTTEQDFKDCEKSDFVDIVREKNACDIVLARRFVRELFNYSKPQLFSYKARTCPFQFDLCLVYLDLSNIGLTRHHFPEIEKSMKQYTNLKCIDLENNQIVLFGSSELEQLLTSNPESNTILNFMGNQCYTFEILNFIYNQYQSPERFIWTSVPMNFLLDHLNITTNEIQQFNESFYKLKNQYSRF